MSLEAYFESARKLGPNPFYAVLEPFLPATAGRALEIGFGVGTGLVWWAERGWQVTGLDPDPGMCEEANRICAGNPLVTVRCEGALEAAWPEVDVVAAVFSTFFLGRADESALLARVRAHLQAGGIFACQLLGPHDDWAKSGMPSHTRTGVDRIVEGYSVLHRQEVDQAGKTVYGEPKHWHVHHLILQKK